MWSDSFHFDGTAITDNPIVLKDTDRLAYSSAMAEGDPMALVIRVEDTIDQEITADIFADYSETPVEGTVTWDYTNEEFVDFPTDDIYCLKEIIATENDEGETEVKTFTRFVTILPEPTGFLLLGLAAAFFLRKRVKSLLAVIALIGVSALSVKAEGSITEVKCLQMWPFDRSVIINFKVEGDFDDAIEVKFYGSTDNGETSFDLTERGTLRKDGSVGTIARPGKYKAIWTPDESFEDTVTDDMKVRVVLGDKPDPPSGGLYMVVDLESGDISYLDAVPQGGWTEEYKTTKMVLRKVKAGKFTMGSPEDELGRFLDEIQREVKLTEDFYIGVFETTQKQYKTIKGNNPSDGIGDMKPVERISYDDIRGSEKGAGWPANNDVDETSFLGKLRTKTGKDFDLPTDAQWEYACRAGTTTALYDGNNLTDMDEDSNSNKLCWYYFNSGDTSLDPHDDESGYEDTCSTHSVGQKLPNSWGLYDMYGNVKELCLDRFNKNESRSSDPVTDPVGPAEGNMRLYRGADFRGNARYCRSAYWDAIEPSFYSDEIGFRVVLVP